MITKMKNLNNNYPIVHMFNSGIILIISWMVIYRFTVNRLFVFVSTVGA